MSWTSSPHIARAQIAVPEVPVLCYHQVRLHSGKEQSASNAITVPPQLFEAHMKMLHDSGYHAILPDELFDHYRFKKPLPSKPVMITFDDNTASQYTAALPVLNRYGFKAVFFVMTVSLDKPNYLSRQQIKALHRQGHIIGAHTWDHHNVKSYTPGEWKTQLDQPLHTLQSITGQPVRYFAYPYGSWNVAAIQALEQRGIRMAFILNSPGYKSNPLFTVRRVMVLSSWSAAALLVQMRRSFSQTHW